MQQFLGLQDVYRGKKRFLTLLLSLYHCIYVSQSGENVLITSFSDVISSGPLSFHFEQKEQL